LWIGRFALSECRKRALGRKFSKKGPRLAEADGDAEGLYSTLEGGIGILLIVSTSDGNPIATIIIPTGRKLFPPSLCSLHRIKCLDHLGRNV
jgi:hypothetical protein